MTHRCNMIGLRPRLRRVLDLAPPREKEKQKKKKKKTMMTKREPKQKQKQDPGARSRSKQQAASSKSKQKQKQQEQGEANCPQKRSRASQLPPKGGPRLSKAIQNQTQICTFSDFEGYLDHPGGQAPNKLHFGCNLFAKGLKNNTQNR